MATSLEVSNSCSAALAADLVTNESAIIKGGSMYPRDFNSGVTDPAEVRALRAHLSSFYPTEESAWRVWNEVEQ